jgi:hypothetical protein
MGGFWGSNRSTGMEGEGGERYLRARKGFEEEKESESGDMKGFFDNFGD